MFLVMKKIRNLIFDADGTLWDSAPKMLAVYRYEYDRHPETASRPLTAKDISDQLGKVIPDIATALLPDLPVDFRNEVIADVGRSENAWFRKDPPLFYPGVSETIRTLAKDHTIYIVSNCQAGYIESLLSVCDFADCIRDHLCPGDTGEGKAENMRTLSLKHGFSFDETAYIGDTYGDYMASKKAGVFFIHAAFGYGEVPEPDARIESYADLLNFF